MCSRCDFCRSNRLELAYVPGSTERGLKVFVCGCCGLVQSLPRIDHVAERRVSTSAGAAWGNVRYGKAFRTSAALVAINRVRDPSRVSCCLDVGASRGSFIDHFRRINPTAELWAIEPDTSVAGPYAVRTDLRFLACRLEAATLPPGRFDLVYCCHTLEHLRSPRRALRQLHRSMRPGGLLFLDVPRLDFIGRDDVIEEFFIDKHLYHFSERLLTGYARASGFSVREDCGQGDATNLMLVVEKTCDRATQETDYGNEAERARRLLNKYEATRRNSVATVQRAARCIELLAERRVVVWGAGRIFDSLVQQGGLSTRRLAGVVDRFLPAYVREVHGLPLHMPEDLPSLRPEVLVVASREYASEIRNEAMSLCPHTCQIIDFQQLVAA